MVLKNLGKLNSLSIDKRVRTHESHLFSIPLKLKPSLLYGAKPKQIYLNKKYK